MGARVMNQIPPPPPGFVVQGAPPSGLPPPPPGFQLQQGANAIAAPPAENWAPPGVLAPIQYRLGEDGKPNGMRLAVPQLVTDALNAAQAPGRALRGEYDQLEVNPDGSVSQFDPRMMSDASALAGMVSPVSAASRLGTAFGAGAKGAAARLTPEIDDLYAAKNAAYKTVDNLGAQYSSEAIDSLYMDMYRRVGEANIDPTPDGVHKATVRMLERLQDRSGPTSLTRLDQLRQLIRRDVINSGSDGDKEMGRRMIDSIDDFIDNAGPDQISGVTGETASWAIRTARQANTVLRKSETLQEALENARLRAASSGSGGNIENTIRQELRKIVTSPKKSMGFTREEIAQMKAIIDRGGPIDSIVRTIGKLSPTGNGLMAALGLGATATNPLFAAAPAIGLVSKALSDRATQGATEALTRTVRSGGNPTALPPVPGPFLPKANTTLLEQNSTRPLPTVLPLGNGSYRLST